MDKKEFEKKGIDLCPKKLPYGMGEWLRGIVKYDNVLLYKKGGRKGYCYACGHEVHAEAGTHFSMTRMAEQYCPRCGEAVLPILDGSTVWSADYYCNVATIQPGKKDSVWIRLWHVNRVYGRPLRLKDDLHEVCRWGINGRQVVKWQKEENMRMGWSSMSRCEKVKLDQWTRMGRPADVYDGSYRFYVPVSQKDKIRTGPLQYADILGYLTRETAFYSQNIIRWLVEFARYPAFEKIDKAGFLWLTESKIAGERNAKAFRWTKNTLEEFLGFPLRLIEKRNRATITYRELRCLRIVWEESRKGLCKETEILGIAAALDKYVYRSQVDFPDIGRLQDYVSVRDAVRYAEKHDGTIRFYLDYLDQCKLLNLDLTDRKVLFPKHLTNAHTRTNSMIRYKEIDALRIQFAEYVKTLEKMAWTDGRILIRPAESQEELISEGKVLEHCVGGYAERMAKGKTAIFLIRKVDNPDTPFYTLEYKDGLVIQCRGYQNRGKEMVEGLTEFVEAWTAWISRKVAA